MPTVRPLYPPDEAALVQACVAGDRAAQRTLYDSYVTTMMAVCCRYLPAPEEAEEALMDGFLSFFKSLHRFQYRGPGSLKAWLKAIVVNACLQKLRARRGPELLPEEVGAAAVAEDTDTLNHLSAREIAAMVQSLPDGYRAVFNLAVFEEWTHAQIAAHLGISESTSKTQLFKARAALRTRLASTYTGHEKRNRS